MSKSFFTFPLSLLAMPANDYKDRMQRMVSHSIVRAGNGVTLDDDNSDLHRITEFVEKHKLKFNRSEAHKRAIIGALTCKVTIGDIQSTIQRAGEAKQFIESHEAMHGTSPLVFIGTEIFWDCHNDGDPSYRDFSVLCAVNSIIAFKKTPVLIRRCMIEARQLGYKTPSSLILAMTQAKKGEIVPLTTQQLRDSLDRMEERDFFRRCQPSRTCVYFSTTLTRDELREAVKTRWEKKGWLTSYREADRIAFARTKQEPSENHLKRKQVKQAKKEPLKNEAPSGNQGGTNSGTTNGTKREPLKEKPVNKSLETSASKEKPVTGESEKKAAAEYLTPEEREEYERMMR